MPSPAPALPSPAQDPGIDEYPPMPAASYPCGPEPYVLEEDAWSADLMRAYFDLGRGRPIWHEISGGLPAWTDDKSIRVIALTAGHDFGGVQMHDVPASDFYTFDPEGPNENDVGTEVTQVCTHWAYRDDLWPRPTPATAPQKRIHELEAQLAIAAQRAAELEDINAQLCEQAEAAAQAHRELQLDLESLKSRTAPAPTDRQG